MKFLYLSFILLFFSCTKTTEKQQDHSKNENKDSAVTTNAKQDLQVFEYENELCLTKATYDANKYSLEEINGAYRLFFRHYEDFMVESYMVFDLEALNRVRSQKTTILKKMDEEYDRKAKSLMALEIPKTGYWKKVKDKQLASLEKSYQKNRLEIEAYSNPKVLEGHPYSKGECEKFVTALNGDKMNLLKFWKNFQEERSRMNADPEGIMKKFAQQATSANYFDYAKIDLITFGWGNCVPEYTEYPIHDENIQKEFNALFTKIDEECGEP